ncbi:MAG: 1-deoxy-D-xylulose-5-phosphate reductoisomerase, partial [Pseudomonadota bacterium]|nr:1-deoxy-D-xylulose-5-phosphate reductoisomerase [Pseudomonadota bacterium]
MRHITILGATGSIGTNTLDVIKQHPESYTVFALTAYSQMERLIACCRYYHPSLAVVANAKQAEEVSRGLKGKMLKTEVLYGEQGLIAAATDARVDTVMAAIVGAAGLKPTLAAARAGKRILLANKEALVMSGQIFMDAVHQYRSELLPIDSEHNAVFQSLPMDYDRNLADRVRRILLTASGGPFLNHTETMLAQVTPEAA